MIKLPPIFVALRKSIYQSAKTPEEAAKHKQWAKEDFSAEPREEDPPKPPPKARRVAKPDIHMQAAHYLTHAHHAQRMMNEYRPGSELYRKHQERNWLHRNAAESLMARGAKPRRRHFEEISKQYAKRIKWSYGPGDSPPARFYVGRHPKLHREDYHIGMSNSAHTLSRDPMYHGEG